MLSNRAIVAAFCGGVPCGQVWDTNREEPTVNYSRAQKGSARQGRV
jgi:hypothetical protein